ncbi:MAG TPA: hypothetical protein VMW91_02630 [Desulfosporosinus sp.]|nr:hypothetical protein [Desulfosporosinus sp.]
MEPKKPTIILPETLDMDSLYELLISILGRLEEIEYTLEKYDKRLLGIECEEYLCPEESKKRPH